MDFIKFHSNSNITDNEYIFIVLNDSKKTLPEAFDILDSRHNNIISHTLNNNQLFSGKFGSMKSLTMNDSGYLKHVILVGAGQNEKVTDVILEDLGAKIITYLSRTKAKNVAIYLSEELNGINKARCSCLIAFGAYLANYKFDIYKTKIDKEEESKLENINICLDDYEAAEKIYNSYYKAVAKGVCSARTLINEPGNILFAASYAQRVLAEFENIPNVNIRILGEAAMKELGMNALLGVNKGSVNEPRLVVIEYKGKGDDSQPLAFIGKGVTFDTGGICIKPSSGMWKMKYDMSGSAVVFGLLKSLALRKAKVNAIGVLGIVENMASGSAQRPGDIVTTMSGKTVEVIDTDAEGRLVLADAMWYAQEKYNPKLMIDIATLTGAVVVALGDVYAGLFTENDEMKNQLKLAGKKSGEELWHMPLAKEYDKMIKSDWADLANLGNPARNAGASTAAQFLANFTNDVPWAHLDIAGVAWSEGSNNYRNTKGATAFGIKLLNQFIRDNHEE